jgi:hypothetical protein
VGAYGAPDGSVVHVEQFDADLRRESGVLVLLTPTDFGPANWPTYLAEAAWDTRVVLQREHDHFESFPPTTLAAWCLRRLVATSIESAAERVRMSRA